MIIAGLKKRLSCIRYNFSYLTPTAYDDDFQVAQFLGQGSTSRVFNAYDIVRNQRVVLKLFKTISPEKLQRQIRILNTVRDCPNIVGLKDVVQNQGTKAYGLIFHDYPGVTLNKLIKNIQIKEIKSYIRNILETLACLHSKGIMHRDIKASNILICGGEKRVARLLDFGLAETIQPDKKYKPTVGTKCYKPPELLLRRTDYDQSLDIWGVGVILAEMFYQVKPLFRHNPNEVEMLKTYMKVAGGVNFSELEVEVQEELGLVKFEGIPERSNIPKVDPLGKDLVHKLMAFSPKNRLSAEAALKHPFLNT